MALILRNGGSQSPGRWLRDPRNNHHYPPTGYSGYVDELSNQLNTAVISYASVCILQAGAFRILQKIFQKLCPLFGKAKSRLYYPAKRGGTTAFRQKGGEHHDT